MENPNKCNGCIGYSICANHIKKNDMCCKPFLRLVEEKLTPTNNESRAIALWKRLVDSFAELDFTEDCYEFVDDLVKEWRSAKADIS